MPTIGATPITGATFSGYSIPPKSLGKASAVSSDFLYKATLPDDETEEAGVALVYSRAAVQNEGSFGASAYFLQNTDGTLFSVDAETLTTVASGKDLVLYAYSSNSPGSADKYTFSATGIAKSDAAVQLDALSISAAEVATGRDIDGNEVVGANLDTDTGILDQTGGLYKVSVAGEDIFVVGTRLDQARAIDASAGAMLNADGSFWSPDTDSATMKVVKKTSAERVVTWDIYATNTDTNEITRYSFDRNRKLLAGSAGSTLLTGEALAAAEKLNKRDLNDDSFVGVEISGTLDARTGLYQGEILGQTFILAGANLRSGTASAPLDTAGTLIGSNDEAWTLADNFNIGAAVKGTGSSANELYVYAVDINDENSVVKFTFVKNTDTNNFEIANEDGAEVSATELAAAEKATKRDLNNDEVYGVSISSTPADRIGGLYKATALGNSFLLVGANLTSTASKPLDLSTALVNADGSAWLPDDVSELNPSSDTPLSIVARKTDGAVVGYDVYVKEDAGSFAKYSFGVGAGDELNIYQLDENGRTELSLEDLAAAEKTTKRDLNGDLKFGVVFSVNASDSIVDRKGGLYKGSFGADIPTVYVKEATAPALGSGVASRAIDLTNALRTSDGADYWGLDDPENYTIKSAYTDSADFNVIAVSNDDQSLIQRYTFEQVDGQWKQKDGIDGYADLTLTDLSQIEDDLRRDLNGDTAIGVKITATADKVGGLQVGTAGGRDFLLVGANAFAVGDLTSALVTADGSAWGTDADGQFDTEIYDAATDKLSLVADNGGGYTLYVARTADDVTTVRQYEFNADKTLVENDDSGKSLGAIGLADAEKSAARDLDGDRSIGARFAQTIDKVGGLHKAQINGSDFYVIVAGKPEKGLSLTNKVLFADDEKQTGWGEDNFEGTLVGVASRGGSDGYYVYTKDTVDGAVAITRHEFDEDRVYQESTELDASQLAIDEKLYGRDFDTDGAVGAKVTQTVDKAGGLYKTQVLGHDYYVVAPYANGAAQPLKTGTRSDNAINLSRALFDEDLNAWAPEDGFSVAGIVKNSDSSYSAFTFQKDNNNVVTSVKKTTWDSDFVFVSSGVADEAELVELETDSRRDFSGDGLIGFRVVTNSNAGYRGVTEAKIFGDTSFWLVGDNVKQGTKASPLTLQKSLLNEDGTAPWAGPGEGLYVKAVVDSATENERYVYVTNYDGEPDPADDNQVYRFTFNKTTGEEIADSQESVDGLELTNLEVDLRKDLDGDGVKGAYNVTLVGNAADKTGLLQVKALGKTYIVLGDQPRGVQSIDLSRALLDDTGTSPWEKPGGVTLKGFYVNGDGNTEIYGKDANDAIARFVFVSSTSADGTTVLKWNPDSDLNSDSNALSGTDVALREADADKDFNADGAIGFKVSALGNSPIKQANGWTLGEATSGDDEIYIVGKSLSTMGTKAGGPYANNAALFTETLDDETQDTVVGYWKPDEGYTVKSILQESDSSGKPITVSIFAEQDDKGDNASDDYIRYTFRSDAALSTPRWLLDVVEPTEDGAEATNGQTLNAQSMAELEATNKRDFNGDGAYGLSLDSNFTSLTIANSAQKIFRAKIDDAEFYLLGANLQASTAQRPLGFNGLLLAATEEDADPVAWKPAEGVTITSFTKITDATRAAATANDETIPDEADYKAVLSDDSIVYFDQATANNRTTFTEITA